MKTRPRIKIKLSQLDRTLELLSLVMLFLLWSLTLYELLKLPSAIPVHFNSLGQADSYGNKITLLLLPIFATAIYFALSQLNKYPHLFNCVTKITTDNAERQYNIAIRMFRYVKLSILIVFTLIVLFTYLTVIGVTNGLGNWFLPLTLELLFLPVIISITKSLKEK